MRKIFQPRRTSNRKKLLRRAALVAAGFLAACVAGEFALALLRVPSCAAPNPGYPMQFAVGPGTELSPGFRGRAWDMEFSVNSIGLRGPEVPLEKPAGGFRLLCLGDSCTFGYGAGIGDGDTFCARLADLVARKTGRPADALNAGVPGYSSRGALLALRRKRLLDYKPDLVVIYAGWNDAKPLSLSDRRIERLTRYTGRLNRSRLFSVVYRAVKRQPFFALEKCGFLMRAPSRIRVTPAEFEDNVSQMLREARNAGAEVALVTVPYDPGAAVADPMRRIEQNLKRTNDSLRAIAAREGTPLLDAAARMDGRPEGGLLADAVHPNRAGHEWLAGELFKLLRPGRTAK